MKQWDIIVIGGGIAGLGVAQAAVRDKRSVLVLERESCGAHTSQGSLRIIHGGFRYLQTLNIRRVLESSSAQVALLNEYPDIVKPLPCLMPLKKYGMKSKLPLRGALTFYSALSKFVGKTGPIGEILSKEQVEERVPVLEGVVPHGALLWWDAALSDHNELVKRLIAEIHEKGGEIREGIAVTKIVAESSVGRVFLENGEEYIGKIIVNAAGEAAHTVRPIPLSFFTEVDGFALAFNLSISKPLHPEYGIAFPSDDGRLFFAVPRGDRGAVGTEYICVNNRKSTETPRDNEVQNFKEALIRSLPAGSDIFKSGTAEEFGILPLTRASDAISLVGRGQISRHGVYRELLTTKYTTFQLQGHEAIRK